MTLSPREIGRSRKPRTKTMSEKKRKTHTSTEVKYRYNKKTYEEVRASLPKDLAARFKEKCAAEGVPQAQVIKKAVIDFLGEN